MRGKDRRAPNAFGGVLGAAFFTGWIAVLLHVTADFWNDYGVHPFWPAVNQWFYGDFIFIFEPLFWLCLLPFAFRIARTQSARIASIVLGGGLLAACWSGHYMSWPVALWLSAWTVLWTLVHRRKASVSAAFASIAVVLALFAVPSQIVRERLKSALPAGEELLQMVTTPSPGNPLCWRVIVSSRLAHPEGAPPTDYRARVGGVGVGQEWFRLRANDPKTCVLRAWTDNSALWAQVDAPSLHQPGMTWAGEFRGGLQEFSHLVSTHCRLRALLRFVRVPYWFASPSGSVVAGDLRYHSGSGLGFADIQSEAGEECFAHEPPWKSPSLLNNVD